MNKQTHKAAVGCAQLSNALSRSSCVGLTVEVALSVDASLVLPCLFLGSHWPSADLVWLRNNNVKAIVNLAIVDGYPNKYPEEIDYISFRVRDSDNDDDNRALADSITKSIVFIAKHIKQNHAVLVHCRQGLSRSASIVIAFMMHSQNVTLKQALAKVREVRPKVQPNHGFMRTLISMEKELRGKASLSANDYPAPILLGPPAQTTCLSSSLASSCSAESTKSAFVRRLSVDICQKL